jgi:rare lipoprotein A
MLPSLIVPVPIDLRSLPSIFLWPLKRMAGRPLRWTFYLIVFFLIAGCTSSYLQKEPELVDHPQRGVASWYGPGFHGKLTANGEVYDMLALTAAHRTLPFGTRVLVRSEETGKSVTVRINDRGPFIRGRIIDLSYIAARELAMIGKGTEEVSLTILDSPESENAGSSSTGGRETYWVQAASFSVLAQAVSLREQLASHYPHVRLKTVDLPSGQWHRVQVGSFPSHNIAEIVAAELENQFRLNPLLVQDN